MESRILILFCPSGCDLLTLGSLEPLKRGISFAYLTKKAPPANRKLSRLLEKEENPIRFQIKENYVSIGR